MKAQLENSAGPPQTADSLARTLASHWPEYLMEAGGLGIFMLSACVFAVLLGHPASAVRQAVEDPLLRRGIGGIAMGLTAIGIICSPWGQRSGAHLNPAVTLSFFLLGKIRGRDALFYAAAQFLGGLAGVQLAEFLIGFPLRHSAVNYAVTLPGESGVAIAFWAEAFIALLMMSMVLVSSNHRRLSRYTPFFAGLCVAAFITVESPLSGMSMNPARTFASAWPAWEWTGIWIYFTAPPLGMLLAALLYRLSPGGHRVFCAKLHHHNGRRCIFRCNYGELDAQ